MHCLVFWTFLAIWQLIDTYNSVVNYSEMKYFMRKHSYFCVIVRTLLLSDLHQDRKAQFTTKIYALFSILNISGNMTANTHLQLCGKLQWDEIFYEEAFLFLCNLYVGMYIRGCQNLNLSTSTWILDYRIVAEATILFWSYISWTFPKFPHLTKKKTWIVSKPSEGGNYSRAETIWRNTGCLIYSCRIFELMIHATCLVQRHH